jgi:phospholipid/cholesterol/gamma-HCH transport system substrate-binding protein
MEPKVNYLLVGLFVVVLGAASLAVVLWLSKGEYAGVYDRYYTYMRESVSGLSVDSVVRYQGVEVGRVKEIVLDPNDPEEVRLALDLVRGTPVKEDTVAVLETQGLTGLTTVNLTDGTRDSPPLTAKPGQKYPVIKSGPSLLHRLDSALSRILADKTFPALLGNLNSLVQDTRGVVDVENRAELKRILADLAKVTHTLAANQAQLGQSVIKAAEALERFASLGKNLDEELPQIIAEAKASIRSFQNMNQKLARAGASFESAVNSNRSNIEQFTGQTLEEAGLAVSEFYHLTVTLQKLAEELEREPNALIFGRPRPAPGPGE